MKRVALLLLVCLPVSGCRFSRPEKVDRDEASFGPSSMRLHPVFTRLKDWSGDGTPDGIEAMVEFQDRFADPTKAAGRVIFELYGFRPNQPDPRGQRLANPWVGSLLTVQDQRDRWSRASRTYTFPLALEGVDPATTYVLTAQYDGNDGKRYFDRLILEGRSQAQPE